MSLVSPQFRNAIERYPKFEHVITCWRFNYNSIILGSYVLITVPPGQTLYTKQKCKDGLNGACFELVNAAGQAEVQCPNINQE